MSSSEPLLEVRSLSARWDHRPVLQDISFEVRADEVVVLLGPNGSGKTTLLRCLAGLEPLHGGEVRLEGRDLATVPTHRRGLALMFQEPALFPHRTVFENIAYAPLLQRRPRPEIDEVVGRFAGLLGLAGFEDRDPSTLSGGERQKVALARTLAARPRLVLLDEPFASIDVEARAELRAEFRRALRESRTGAIHVTHDREEGFFLGDRVGLLFEGRLDAWGSPGEIAQRPRTTRAAKFLGYNVLPGPDGPVAVWPTELRVRPEGGSAGTFTVVAAGTVGAEALVVLRSPEGERVEWRIPEPFARPAAGTQVSFGWPTSRPVGAGPGRP